VRPGVKSVGQRRATGASPWPTSTERLIDGFINHLNEKTHTLWRQEPRRSITRQERLPAGGHNSLARPGFGTPVLARLRPTMALHDLASSTTVGCAKGPPRRSHDGPFGSLYGGAQPALSHRWTGRFKDV